MFPKPKVKQVVKPLLDRFVEDRLEKLNMTHDQLADKMAEELGMKYPLGRLTRRINYARMFPADELACFAKILELKDWYEDLVVNFGAGLDNCTVAQFDEMLHPLGYELGRQNVAA
jgi:hypothetical protein